MYSASARLSAFIGFFFSCLLSTLAVIAASNFIFYRSLTPSNINFEVKKLSLYNLTSGFTYFNFNFFSYRGIEDPYMNKPATLADMRFDLQIDFSPIFHWNTKLVYLYLVLEYTTPYHHRNEMIIWDKIIQSPQITGYKDGGKFTTRNARNKYPITDVSDQL